jgi:tRNA G18 (ribose-2'-O)-methylase SpoU
MNRIIYGINPVKEALKSRTGEIEKIVVSKQRRAPEEVIKAAAKKKWTVSPAQQSTRVFWPF